MKKKYERLENDFEVNETEYAQKKEALSSFFSNKDYAPSTQKQLSSFFCQDKRDTWILQKILKELEEQGVIIIDDSKRYVLATNFSYITCKYQNKTAKFGFGIVAEGKDIYITKENSLNAMDGDDVLVKVLKDSSKSEKKCEGKIIKILKRNTKRIIGRYIKNQNFGFVEPIQAKIQDIYIPKKFSKVGENGEIVEVEILKYATAMAKAEGKILSVIGNSNEKNIEVKALYHSYGLNALETFNYLVEEEVEKIPLKVTEEEKQGRIDKTHEHMYTIDSEDAKDLDDAVFVKKNNDGTYLLSVCIADVSHYVKDGTYLDTEAVARGSSIYVPGTVIPMLPKALSNGICSLNEGEERLCLAVDMKINAQGVIEESTIYQAVIKVTKKMTYEKVWKVLNREDKAVLAEYQDYIEDIDRMQELALILKKRRKQEGNIDFDIPETKVELDKEGNVIDIHPYEITFANKIIEEFMLAANMTVAEKFFYLEMPFIYRVHDIPDEDKLRDLNLVLSNYHKYIKGIKNIHPKELAIILEELQDDEERMVVSNFMLRALKMAKYSEECTGHFGLAAKFYCHFTSPIRRYPDLFIHRVITSCLENQYILPEELMQKYQKQSIIYAMSSSDCEKNATQIERDFDDLYKALYMQKQVGQTFFARVSSITSFGMFVKLDNTVEGLVAFDAMPDHEYYLYDETKKILIGRDSGNIFRIGDKVKVKLTKVDVKLKQIDFKVLGGKNEKRDNNNE